MGSLSPSQSIFGERLTHQESQRWRLKGIGREPRTSREEREEGDSKRKSGRVERGEPLRSTLKLGSWGAFPAGDPILWPRQEVVYKSFVDDGEQLPHPTCFLACGGRCRVTDRPFTL